MNSLFLAAKERIEDASLATLEQHHSEPVWIGFDLTGLLHAGQLFGDPGEKKHI